MSKADLKAAMESLQVNKPLRLSASAPAFKTPPSVSQDVPASEDANTSLVQSTSKGESRSKVGTQNPNHSVETTSVSQVPITSQDVDASKVDAASVIPRASQPRRATEQDRAVTEAVSLKSRLSTG